MIAWALVEDVKTRRSMGAVNLKGLESILTSNNKECMESRRTVVVGQQEI